MKRLAQRTARGILERYVNLIASRVKHGKYPPLLVTEPHLFDYSRFTEHRCLSNYATENSASWYNLIPYLPTRCPSSRFIQFTRALFHAQCIPLASVSTIHLGNMKMITCHRTDDKVFSHSSEIFADTFHFIEWNFIRLHSTILLLFDLLLFVDFLFINTRTTG